MCHALLQELTAAKLLEQQQAAARKRERAEQAALKEAARIEERKLLRLKAKESAAEARRMHTEPLHAPRTVALAPEAVPMAVELGSLPSPLRPPHDTPHAREHGAVAEP